MVKRSIFFMQILLLLIMAGAAFGTNHCYGDCVGWSGWSYWSTASSVWSDPVPGSSWWNDGQPYFPPNDVDVASMDNPCPVFCLIDSNTVAKCLELQIGHFAAEGTEPAVATLDVNGGTLIVGEDVLIGILDTTQTSDYAIGDFNMISGTVSVGKNLYIGREGIGTLNMRSGTFNVNETIWCPGGPMPAYNVQTHGVGQTYEYGTGYLNLYGGTIEANNLMVYEGEGCITQISIDGGTLILNGDKTSTIADLINQGKLYHAAGGDIVFDYNVSNPGKTTVTGTFDPNCATRPDPGNYAIDVNLLTDLSWEPGINVSDVNGHDVYFGTSFEDVNEANNTPGVWPEFKGNQDSNTYDPDPCDPCTGELAVLTTYYWRIDEVNTVTDTNWRGNVWKFTTEDPFRPSEPVPPHNKRDVPASQILGWTEGRAANSHDVYIGSSFDEVNEATMPTATLVGDSNTSYAPPNGLTLGEVDYYWRVVEVNTVTITTWPGPVWKFTTDSRRLIDDFEEYTSSNPITNAWKAAGGVAGISTESTLDDDKTATIDGNAMKVTYANSSDPWYSEVSYEPHIPSQGLKPSQRDWVLGGVKVLGINFHGVESNTAEKLYVTIKDSADHSATVQYSDSNDLIQWVNEIWHWWAIDLDKFTDVNLTDVRNLVIGLGDGVAPGYTGTMYFDNVALYPPVCLNQDGDADLNNDCAVDANDIELLTDDWLKTGYDVNAGTYDMNVGLVVWYKFDEGSGYDAVDSSGNGHTGVLNLPNWDSPGYDGTGSCVEFYDLLYIDVPGAAASVGMGGHSTVALWMNDDGIDVTMEGFTTGFIGAQLFQVGPGGQGNLQVFLPYNGYFQYTCGWDEENLWGDMVVWGEDGYNNPEHPLGQWVHYAFVKDATEGEGVMRIYQNGKIVAEQDDNTGLEMPDPNDPNSYFTLGAWQWTGGTGGYYYGLMDDFRLYNRVLSQQEIMDLANVSSLHQPVVSYAEVVADDTVNFEDYAVVAAKWLEEPLLWP